MRWIVDLPTQGQRHIVVSEVVNAGPAVERLDNGTGSVPEGSLERPSPKLDAFRAVSLVHAIQLGVSAISWSSSLAVIRSRCIRTFATRSISAQCSSTNSSQFCKMTASMSFACRRTSRGSSSSSFPAPGNDWPDFSRAIEPAAACAICKSLSAPSENELGRPEKRTFATGPANATAPSISYPAIFASTASPLS
ncbi:hypothetical protein ACVWZ6_002884 [Bradyrhizobium sp. GM6.1]